MMHYHEIMTSYRRSSKPPVAREPVQVYLDGPEQERLERLTSRLAATKSDVLRRGLEALERQVLDPSTHPALSIVGILNTAGAPEVDAAREHDRLLADSEVDSWLDAHVD